MRPLGVDATTWTDHVNLRPTMLALLGLRDDYRSDGRALLEGLDAKALPPGLAADVGAAQALGDVYEQLNAPFGRFGLATLAASTRGLAGGSAADDAAYTEVEREIGQLTDQRDLIAQRIVTMLNDAAFGGQPVVPAVAAPLMAAGNALLEQATRFGAAG